MTNAIEIAEEVLGDLAQRDVPIGPMTTYRLGGPARLYINVESDQDLELVRDAVAKSGLPTLVIGKGSNLLVSDEGFDGLVITLGQAYAEVSISGTTVRAGGATPLPVLARKTAAAGLHGLEWAVGVPGSVGGALRMNAGGHGSQTVESLVRCHICDLSGEGGGELKASDLNLAYRSSSIRSTQIVIWAEFELEAGDKEKAEHQISEIVKWRREHQPGGRNAGSIFTNPTGDSAGRLIDSAGLRGFRLGTAQVSEKHANFIQSDDDGKAQDVFDLIQEVIVQVEQSNGVRLEPEVRLVGFESRGSK